MDEIKIYCLSNRLKLNSITKILIIFPIYFENEILNFGKIKLLNPLLVKT